MTISGIFIRNWGPVNFKLFVGCGSYSGNSGEEIATALEGFVSARHGHRVGSSTVAPLLQFLRFGLIIRSYLQQTETFRREEGTDLGNGEFRDAQSQRWQQSNRVHTQQQCRCSNDRFCSHELPQIGLDERGVAPRPRLRFPHRPGQSQTTFMWDFTRKREKKFLFNGNWFDI